MKLVYQVAFLVTDEIWRNAPPSTMLVEVFVTNSFQT